jgi:lipoyl(octanoyl) transferase
MADVKSMSAFSLNDQNTSIFTKKTIINTCLFKSLGRLSYHSVWEAMKTFTQQRDSNTIDEIWFVEHDPVYTQGLAGKKEHLLFSPQIPDRNKTKHSEYPLSPAGIPIIQVDRGGQITYHGPGQLLVYFLIDIKRKKIGVRQLVTHIESIIIDLLAMYQIIGYAKKEAPGIYVKEKKIASLGLKIKKGCSFHGFALNIKMDSRPFLDINPCGYPNLKMIQLSQLGGSDNLFDVEYLFKKIIKTQLHYEFTI